MDRVEGKGPALSRMGEGGTCALADNVRDMGVCTEAQR